MTADVVVNGSAAWNLIVEVDELPTPVPRMRFASAHREVLGGTSAGKSTHLRDLGLSVELHTVVGDDSAGTSIRQALSRAAIPAVLTRVDGASERHLNLIDPH